MKTLQEAMEERAAERRAEMEEIERIDALAVAELERRREQVRELFIEHFSAEYDTDLSGVPWEIHGEVFTVSASIAADGGDGRACTLRMLDTVLRLDDDAFDWTGVGRARNKPRWRVTDRPDGYYTDYDNLLDALIYAYGIDWRESQCHQE